MKYFFIGKFDYDGKNIEFLLKSFVNAHSYNSKIELNLIGDGNKFDTFYKKYSKYNFINFKGKINNDDLVFILKIFII